MTKQECFNAGLTHFAKQEFDAAINFFRQAINIDEKYESAYSALAECYNRSGKVDEAIPVVQKWIEINKHDPLAHTALSRLYVQKNMIEEAEKEMAISNFLAQQES